MSNVTMSFSNDLLVRKLQYQDLLVSNGAYTYEDVVCMSMVELRSAVDELCPIVITQASTTMTGGKTKRVTIVRAA